MRVVGTGFGIETPQGKLEIADMQGKGISIGISNEGTRGKKVYIQDDEALRLAEWLQKQVMG